MIGVQLGSLGDVLDYIDENEHSDNVVGQIEAWFRKHYPSIRIEIQYPYYDCGDANVIFYATTFVEYDYASPSTSYDLEYFKDSIKLARDNEELNKISANLGQPIRVWSIVSET